ncbi:cytochrome c [Hymenobacter aquaticus]|uniref:Cytochrome c n=1 Tax=Hymenobacter aquaticus TaxID=1867101 RepID=A0A4Z0PVC7_9BACT|nr:cytochrome c [Hymenobacter aquaticus]TGE21688.1 cytochrome c [Hymenobacter aquaticus]
MIRPAFLLCASALLLTVAAACHSTPASAPAETAAPAPAPAELPGQALFAQNCAVCHGPDGKLGLNGAHDLTKSNLNATGRVYMVTQGLGKMPSFKDQLSPEQIQQVVDYSLTLK